MVSIEQVRLLESRVGKAIEYVEQVTEENALLKSKLDVYQKRIDELEVLIQRFKEDQAKIEDGIISALDRLNKFEDAMGKGISKTKADVQSAPKRQAAVVEPDEAPAQPEVEETFVIRDSAIDPLSDEGDESSPDINDAPEPGLF
jgi:predicted  nucleic acid-binding Zn-ribbon protein